MHCGGRGRLEVVGGGSAPTDRRVRRRRTRAIRGFREGGNSQVRGYRKMRISLVLAFLLALSPLAVSASSAQTQQKGPQVKKGPAFSHQAEREKVNENLVMVLGGTLGGPWIHMAQDIAIAVGDGDNLGCFPSPARGGKMNVRDILLARGLDLGITRLDVLNDVKASGEYGPKLDQRVAYIAALSVDMLQLLARPEINSLKDLHGKKVNILPKGSIVPQCIEKGRCRN